MRPEVDEVCTSCGFALAAPPGSELCIACAAQGPEVEGQGSLFDDHQEAREVVES